jgi:thiosulfate/3-mercaptopyruvate sulfurtransferase
VSVDWLAQHLNDPNLVLLHVGPAPEYAAAHIPGARLTSVADLSVGDRAGPGLGVEMPSADTLLRRLAALGISDDSRVIVYYAEDMVYQASRILLTLTYAGLGDRASLLDGGMGAWTAAGRATTTETSRARVSVLTPLRIRNFVVDANYVHSMLGAPGASIVDARDTVFYTGARAGGSAQAPQRAGRIPGAKSVVWSTLTDANFRIRPAAELAAAFAAAGVKPGDLVIGYCHTGQQASAMLLAARSLGHRVLLYDGSFQDWSARKELPIETGPAKPKG